jgi:hypothetical protein
MARALCALPKTNAGGELSNISVSDYASKLNGTNKNKPGGFVGRQNAAVVAVLHRPSRSLGDLHYFFLTLPLVYVVYQRSTGVSPAMNLP